MHTPMFSPAAEAAARIYVMLAGDASVHTLAKASPEYYRSLVDIARGRGLHNIRDGSADYLEVVDILDHLVKHSIL